MKTYKKVLAAFLALCSISTVAKAGSYQLNDYSVTGLGRAYAGVGVVGDDYSSIAFNPAGMALKNSGFQVGISEVNLHADINSLEDTTNGAHYYPAGSYGKMDHWVAIPNAFAQYAVSDKVKFGFGVYAPYGLATRYRGDWFGSDTAVESTLTIVDLSPAVSVQVTDKLSIGASFIARYIYGKMTNTLNALGGGKSEFELDGWTVTGTLGALYQFTDDTRVGFSWRARSTQQVKGDHTISGIPGTLGAVFNETATGWASPALPETFTLSAYQKIQKVGLSATARWTHWSQSFPEFVMKSNSHLFNYVYSGNPMGNQVYAKTSKYNYENTWTINLGADYYYNENWTFRFGVAYDEGATHNNTTRTYRIPDNDRFWTSFGFSYMLNNVQVDVGYAHLFVRSSKVIEHPDNGNEPSGKFSTMHSDIFGLQMQYAF